MAFNLNNFAGSLNRNGGIAKQNLVEMTIFPPKVIMNDVRNQNPDALDPYLARNDIRNSLPYGLDWLFGRKNAIFASLTASEGMRFRIDSGEIPGRSVWNINYTDYGLPRRIAYGSNFIETNFTVICSRDLREKILFELWQDIIVGRYRIPAYNPDSGGDDKYSIGYYDDYVGTAYVTQFSEDGSASYEAKLIECYPQNVSPMQFSWGSDDVHRLTVTLTFRYMEDRVLPPKPSTPVIPSAGIMDYISAGAQVAATLNSFDIKNKKD